MASFSMPNLGSGSQQIAQWVEQLVDRKIAQYVRSNPLNVDPQGNVTIPDGNSLTVTGSATIDGTLESGNFTPGQSGYMLGPSQITTYTSIAGFGNGQVAQASATGFGLTTTLTTLGSSTLVVPQGYTRLLAMAAAQVYVVNPNTSGGSNGTGGDAIYAQGQLATPSSGAVYTAMFPVGVSGSNGFATATSIGALGIVGLTPGETLTLSVAGHSAFQSIAAAASNTALVSLAVDWLP